MKDVVFITGNKSKAEKFSKYIGYDVEHVALELDEIQSLDIHTVVEHKVRQAYAIIKRPVLVEDTGIEFSALGKLPGTFTKFFIEALGLTGMCRLLDGRDRGALARCVFGYFDGKAVTFIEGGMKGVIAPEPKGEGGFGYDPIFIPEGYIQTRSEMNEEDYQTTYTISKPFAKVRDFLIT